MCLWMPHQSCCFGLPQNSREPLHQVMETSPYPYALRPAGKPMLSAPTLHRAHPLHQAFPLQMCCSSAACAWSLPSASSGAIQMFPPAGDISHLAIRWPTPSQSRVKIWLIYQCLVWCGPPTGPPGGGFGKSSGPSQSNAPNAKSPTLTKETEDICYCCTSSSMPYLPQGARLTPRHQSWREHKVT